MQSQVVTANRLTDGNVVYLAQDGSWTRAIADAEVADTDVTINTLLQRAADAEANQEIVGVYAIDVSIDGTSVKPTNYKEVIRAKGPTTHTNFGMQALEDPTTAYMNGV